MVQQKAKSFNTQNVLNLSQRETSNKVFFCTIPALLKKVAGPLYSETDKGHQATEPLSFSSKPLTTEINSDLYLPASWSKYQNRLEIFANRIESCKFMGWTSLICKDCGKLLKQDVARLSCLSPYCKDPECISNRKRILLAYIKCLKIYSKNLLHFVIGFPHIANFTRVVRQQHNKVFILLKKELGKELKAIAVKDLTGKKNNIYVHYHLAQLPVKDFRKFRDDLFKAREKIIEKTGIEFTIKFKGYRNMYGLSKYLCERGAGVFGNIKDGTSYGFADLMDLKTYFDSFYKQKKIRLFNLSPRAKPSVLALLLDNSITECPYCKSKNLGMIRNEVLEQYNYILEPKPPPQALRIVTERVGLLNCVSCGEKYYESDMVGKLCKWCYEKTTPEYKFKKIQERFNRWTSINSK